MLALMISSSPARPRVKRFDYELFDEVQGHSYQGGEGPDDDHVLRPGVPGLTSQFGKGHAKAHLVVIQFEVPGVIDDYAAFSDLVNGVCHKLLC